jgi:hypothetical protein
MIRRLPAILQNRRKVILFHETIPLPLRTENNEPIRNNLFSWGRLNKKIQ